MNVQAYILVGMVISIILIWIFYQKPKINSFDYSITFPWRVQDKNVLDCSIQIESKYPELYVNESINFVVKIFNFNKEIYKTHLADRKLIFTMSGLAPSDHIDLVYNSASNAFEGSGVLKFKFAGSFSLQVGYDSNDKVTPSGGMFSSNLSIQLLPSLQKYQIELNDRLFLQSKLTLILTIVAIVLTLLQLFDVKKE